MRINLSHNRYITCERIGFAAPATSRDAAHQKMDAKVR